MLALELTSKNTICLFNKKTGDLIKIRRGRHKWQIAIDAPLHVEIYRMDTEGVCLKKKEVK